MDLITQNKQRIAALCRKHRVKSLCVFGSILTDRFTDASDVDLLVDFEPTDHSTFDYVANYFGLQEQLESIFQRPVDLIEAKGLRNQHFIRTINRSKQMIYGVSTAFANI